MKSKEEKGKMGKWEESMKMMKAVRDLCPCS
jgi:hypothetical protein